MVHRRLCRRLVVGCAVATIQVVAAPAAAPQGYRVAEVPLLPARITNSGQVIGTIETSDGAHAAVFAEGTLTDLGSLGGPRLQIRGTNESGHFVGTAETSEVIFWNPFTGPEYRTLPFLFRDGVLGPLDVTPDFVPCCINDQGLIAGDAPVSIPFGTVPRAHFLHDGVLTLLGPPEAPPYSTRTNALNNAGQLVGRMTKGPPDVKLYPFLYAQGTFVEIAAPTGPVGEAIDINDAGHVLGYLSVIHNGSLGLHGFVADNGALTFLPTLGGGGSRVTAMNRDRQVIGSSPDASGIFRPFVWDSTNGMRSLARLLPPDADLVIDTLADLNDAGQIVGTGMSTEDGGRRSFVLTPTPASPAPDYLPLGWMRRWVLRSAAADEPIELTFGGLWRLLISFEHPWGSADLRVRKVDGKVYLVGAMYPRAGGTEVDFPPDTLYFDFTAPRGATWTNSLGTVTVADRHKTVVTPAGTFTDCIQFWIAGHDGHTTIWTFAPNVGFVQFGEHDWAFLLERAE